MQLDISSSDVSFVLVFISATFHQPDVMKKKWQRKRQIVVTVNFDSLKICEHYVETHSFCCTTKPVTTVSSVIMFSVYYVSIPFWYIQYLRKAHREFLQI